MSVDERGGQPGIDDPLRIDGRMAGRLHDSACWKPAVQGSVGEVLGIAADVGGVGGIGGDARDAEELDELVHVALLVGGAVGVEVVLRHARKPSVTATRAASVVAFPKRTLVVPLHVSPGGRPSWPFESCPQGPSGFP